ncbi:glycosyltransferase [Parabacteroides bouchesdurhonensis]|uniref:glycosyltransferase n=1 Tax=Parabacteroides bouchesdurhonensis TaxID=1936995 RepID=UPI001D0CDA1C|nr:glycosyltransferase family 2 protein [Parabacteroides bouchesdurhonensis]
MNIMILYTLEILLFIIMSLNVLYILIFSIASQKKYRVPAFNDKKTNKHFIILIPAYKEDKVILECVKSCLNQEYPTDKYDIVVISDQMSEETNELLSALPIRLEIVNFENSTKAKALNFAMSHLDGYDIALIMDADNTIKPDFLEYIDKVPFTETIVAYQAHRIAKNKNTNIAYLDAVSEEINNSIFRLGHVNLGFSSALIGSGMAFRYDYLKDELAKIDAVGGFDRALELTLFRDNKKIGYIPDAYVLDEKIQNHKDFSRQRKRWMSAQIHYLVHFWKDIPHAIKTKNWDFCDKMFQQMSFPRLILLGLIFIISFIVSSLDSSLGVKWWILLCVLLMSLALAIPRNLYTKQFLKATTALPVSFFSMFLNLFCMKGANKKFIHTEHGSK